jgi:hypothetical protein
MLVSPLLSPLGAAAVMTILPTAMANGVTGRIVARHPQAPDEAPWFWAIIALAQHPSV